MFYYVFSEADRDRMIAAGFAFVCEDRGSKAWVFLADSSGTHAVPEDVLKVVSSRLAFNGAIGNQENGGVRNA